MTQHSEGTRIAELSSRLAKVRERIDAARASVGREDEVTLVVVTKFFPVSDIQILYDLGERNFGENRVLEGLEKSKQLPKDITWHYQGEIQSNKISSLVAWADLIHSLDNLAHARRLSTISEPNTISEPKAIRAFLQISLDQPPESRGGINPARIDEFLEECAGFHGLEILGLMGIAPVGDSHTLVELGRLAQEARRTHPQLRYLSSGMSEDFELAIQNHATHVRIGSSIMGPRPPAT